MGVLTERQRDALRRLDRNGPNGHAAIHKGSMPGLLKRGLVSKARSWENGGNGRVVWTITSAGRIELGPVPVRAAGTLDLTVHLRDPAVEPSMRPANTAGAYYRTLDAKEGRHPRVREWEGHAGATLCGKLLELSELWVEHEPEAGDPCCRGCFDGEPLDDEPDLWDEGEPVEPERSVETVIVVGGVL